MCVETDTPVDASQYYRRVKFKKILVSQPKPASDKSPYYDLAEKHGVEVVFRPFIKVEGISAKDFRQQKVNIPDFTAISSAFAKRCEYRYP